YSEELEAVDTKRSELSEQISGIDAKLAIGGANGEPQENGAQPAAQLSAEETAKLQQEKKSLEEQIDALQPDHGKSLSSYEDFFQQHQNQSEGWVAGMRSAEIYIDQGNFAKAQELLNGVITNSKDHEFYQIQARLSLIGVLEELGKLDEALGEAETLMTLASGDLKAQALLTKARLLVIKEDKDAARQ